MNGATDELEELRDEIDHVDERIVELLSERIRIAENVARVKSRGGRALVDENRERAVKSHYEDLFRRNELPGEHGRELAEYLIELSLKQEREVERNS